MPLSRRATYDAAHTTEHAYDEMDPQEAGDPARSGWHRLTDAGNHLLLLYDAGSNLQYVVNPRGTDAK
jgi:hypothetical protein